jgi:hypothetical protein
MKTLAQVAYEAFQTEAPSGVALTWDEIERPVKQGGSPIAQRAWAAVAAKVERAVIERLTEARARRREASPDRPVVCTTCKARFMLGEKHACGAVAPMVMP